MFLLCRFFAGPAKDRSSAAVSSSVAPPAGSYLLIPVPCSAFKGAPDAAALAACSFYNASASSF